jgi:hypothetical protein
MPLTSFRKWGTDRLLRSVRNFRKEPSLGRTRRGERERREKEREIKREKEGELSTFFLLCFTNNGRLFA